MVESSGSRSPELRMAIAGLGAAGCMMIPAMLKNPSVKLAGAADLDQPSLDKFQGDFGAEVHREVESLAESPNIDAIYISTPTQFHTGHVLAALENGKHVITEKPMALTLEDADSMIEAARRNGVQFVVGHSHSYETPIQQIKNLVSSGELGELRMMNNWYWTSWLYNPRNREELDTNLGGGVTFRQGSHQFDILRLIGGGLVRSVRAMTGVWDENRPTQGSHVVYLEFENGTPATAVYCGYDRFQTAEITFGVGEGGQPADLSEYARSRKRQRSFTTAEDESLAKASSVRYGATRRIPSTEPTAHPPFYGLTIISCEKGDIRQSQDGLFVYGEEEKKEIPLSTAETGRDHVIQELYDAVFHDKEPLHDGRWGKANLEVCLAVLESARERKEVYLSHQKAVPA